MTFCLAGGATIAERSHKNCLNAPGAISKAIFVTLCHWLFDAGDDRRRLGRLRTVLLASIVERNLAVNSMMQQVQEMRGSLYLQLKEVFDSIFLADEDAIKQFHEFEQRIQTHLNRLENTARGTEERDAIYGLRKSYQAFAMLADRFYVRRSNMPIREKQRVLNTELEIHGINNHEEAIKRSRRSSAAAKSR